MKYTKELLALPTPDCPAIDLPADTKFSAHTGIRNLYVAAQTVVLHNEAFLGVTVYGRDKQPMRRWWLTEKESCMQSFETVKDKYNHQCDRTTGRMYKTAIDTELGIGVYVYGLRDVLTGSGKDTRTVRRFTKRRDGDIGEMIATLQRAQREAVREQRRAEKKEDIRKRFSLIPKEPAEFDTWICDGPLLPYRYFLYAYTRKGKQSGVCTHCKTRSELAGVKTGAAVICPKCGSRLQCRSWKRLPKHGIWGEEQAALYQYAGREIVVRSYLVNISIQYDELTGIVKRTIRRHETYRHFLDPAELGTAVAAYSDRYGRTSLCVDGFNECGEGYGYGDAFVCPIGLGEIRRKLGIYTPVEELADRGLHCDPDALLAMLKRRPVLEYLTKAGLYALANYELNGGDGTALRSGSRLTDVLGVDKETIQKIRQANADGSVLLVVRKLFQRKVSLNVADIAALNGIRIRRSDIHDFCMMARESSPHKAVRYISRQMSKSTNSGDVLQLWRDYVGMAEELGIDLSDGMRLFPRKLRRAHDEAAKLVEMRKNAEVDKRIQKTADDLDDLQWQKYGLLIRPARSSMELFEEGKRLSHCVGRRHYAESMAEGRTAIFFIRREKEPDVPYVTLELSLTGWNKIQCYGKGDTWPGKSVDNFVNEWIRGVVQPAKKATKGAKTA